MCSGGRNESKSQQLARIGQKKIFHEHDVHHVQKVGNKRFWAQSSTRSNRREENFYEVDVYRVYKEGIKRFWAQ